MKKNFEVCYIPLKIDLTHLARVLAKKFKDQKEQSEKPQKKGA